MIDADEERVTMLNPTDSWRAFDGEVRRLLGINAHTFIEQWKAGKIDPEQKEVAFLATFLPSFARPEERD